METNIIQTKLKKYWGYTLTNDDIAYLEASNKMNEFYHSYYLQSKYAIKNKGMRYLGKSIHEQN